MRIDNVEVNTCFRSQHVRSHFGFLISELEYFREGESDDNAVDSDTVFFLTREKQMDTTEVHPRKLVTLLAPEISKDLAVDQERTVVVMEGTTCLEIKNMSFLAKLE